MKRKHLCKLLLLAQAGALLLLLALPAPARAADIEIDGAATTLNSFYQDLDSAIGAALLNDTIEVVFDLGTAAALENYAILSNPIMQDLTIIFRSDGGKLTLSPDGSRRHLDFSINNGVTLTLIFADVILDGGSAGGGINNRGGGSGKLVLQEAVIQNCSTNDNGGGVYALGDLEIKDSSFTGNRASLSGGGVFVSGNLKIENGSVFEQNTARQYGGGIYVSRDLEISASSFTGNQAGLTGGGVYADGSVEVAESTFTGNKATNDSGGGVYAASANSTVTVSGSSFTGNQANVDGGGVYARSVEVKEDSRFERNTAGQDGGGVFVAGNLKIENGSVFEQNTAGQFGGGVYAAGPNSTVTVSASSFTGNRASLSGGGVYAPGDLEIKDGSRFERNTAGQDGGGVYASSTNVIEIADSTFTGNQATSGDGGAIWLDSLSATLSFSGPSDSIIFRDNLAAVGYEPDPTVTGTPPYDTWPDDWVSDPFSHILNNHDVVYTPGSGTPVYLLVCHANDGTGAHHARLDLTYWPSAFPPAPTRGGYTFTGWNEAADGSGAPFTAASSISTPVTANHEVYAQWQPNPAPDPEPEPEPEPTPSGGAAERERSDSYPVRFDLNGGGTALTRYAERGGTLTRPADPTRAGYEFTGWYTDAACTNLYDFAQRVTGGFTLYAGWQAVAAPMPTATHSAYIDGYPDGTFRPEAPLTRAEAAGMLYRLLGEPQAGGAAGFADVTAADWYNAAVGALSGRGLLTGYADGSFRPNTTITRAEFLTLALRYAGEGASAAGAGFADAEGHWAAGTIAAAVEAGYVSGYADGTFRPEAPVTRAEAVAILNRVIGCEGVREGAGFADLAADYWAYADILAASTEHGH